MGEFFLRELYGMAVVDWIVVLVYLLIAFSVGLSFAKRASGGTEEFFLAGRGLRWWLAGSSMVASMFASDTPLFHTGNVRDMGLSASWLFFFPMFGALMAAAYFARLVRRTRVVTDAEFVELRYSGQSPAPFRGFLALYNGIYVAGLTIGWVTIGMTEATSQILNLRDVPGAPFWQDPKFMIAVSLLALVLVYSMVSGMWGVVMADLFQYIIASVGSIYLAIASVHACGGLAAMREKLAAIPNWSGSDLHFIPNLTEGVGTPEMVSMTPWLVMAWVLIYGAQQASSAGHQGQRILACKSEKDASLTYVMFSWCYYFMNGMSWVITGIASMVVLGASNDIAGLANSQRTFPAMIKELMPAGMLGLMMASIFAAFMSCTSVILNWGGSYMINDLYRRFMVRGASDKHYLLASRISCVFLAAVAVFVVMTFETLSDIFSMVPQLLTGASLVMLARYLWWRANIWSEISAYLIAPFVGLYVEFVLGARGHAGFLEWLPGYGVWDAAMVQGNNWHFFGQRFFATVGTTTFLWILVTLLTPATDMAKCKKFYLLVRPSGPGWWHVRRQFASPPPTEPSRVIFTIWVSAVAFVLGAIYTLVTILQGRSIVITLISLVVTIVGAVIMNKGLNRVNQNALDYDASLKLNEPSPLPKTEQPVA